MWDLAASLRIRGSSQHWARAQTLVTRMRKFSFSVAWDVFLQEVKDGRCALGLYTLLTSRCISKLIFRVKMQQALLSIHYGANAHQGEGKGVAGLARVYGPPAGAKRHGDYIHAQEAHPRHKAQHHGLERPIEVRVSAFVL